MKFAVLSAFTHDGAQWWQVKRIDSTDPKDATSWMQSVDAAMGKAQGLAGFDAMTTQIDTVQ